MKYYFLYFFAFISICSTANGRLDGFPALLTSSENPSGFIPEDWTVIAEYYEDLNEDGCPDVVLVVQSPDSRINGSGREEYPKILIIALFDTEENSYILKGWSFALLNPTNQQMTHNKFKTLSCDTKGNVIITLDYIWSGGTYHTNEISYTFRYIKNRFYLVRMENHSIGHHSNFESYETADFLKGRYKAVRIKKKAGKDKITRTSYIIQKELNSFYDVERFMPGITMNVKRKGIYCQSRKN